MGDCRPGVRFPLERSEVDVLWQRTPHLEHLQYNTTVRYLKLPNLEPLKYCHQHAQSNTVSLHHLHDIRESSRALTHPFPAEEREDYSTVYATV